jgi:FkbM family methyltransferase
MKRNGKQFYTKGGELIDISTWDISGGCNDLGDRYGWEGVMAYGNLIHDELNAQGPGIQPGDIYLDLGANIGMSALRAEQSGASKLYCIEPDPGVYKALEMNKSDNWEIFNMAIADYNGEIDIPQWPDWGDNHSRPCFTLDTFFKFNNIQHIDYMKVDIEGHEIKTLPSIPKSVYDKISKLFIEFHEDDKITNEERDVIRLKFITAIKNKGYINHHIHLGFYQSFMYFWK